MQQLCKDIDERTVELLATQFRLSMHMHVSIFCTCADNVHSVCFVAIIKVPSTFLRNICELAEHSRYCFSNSLSGSATLVLKRHFNLLIQLECLPITRKWKHYKWEKILSIFGNNLLYFYVEAKEELAERMNFPLWWHSLKVTGL